jgi:hypothetical protein
MMASMGDAKIKPSIFVVMSFAAEMTQVYELAIRPACIEAGAQCTRVDKEVFAENVMSRTYSQIRRATLVVGEMSGRSPNVFYEVGYAHGIGKVVIPVTTQSDDIPFDLKHYPHIVYNGDLVVLKRELFQRVSHFLDHPERMTAVIGQEVELMRMTEHIINYMTATGFTKVSFDRIRARVNADYSDAALLTLIDQSPSTFRRVLMQGDRAGIGLLS